jgi:hypothetical protein
MDVTWGQLREDIEAAQKAGYNNDFNYREVERIIGQPAIKRLEYAGLVVGGSHTHFRYCIWQSPELIKRLLPSLEALKKGRRFKGDVNQAAGAIHGLKTLDYEAWRLTEYQEPGELYVYVKDMESAERLLTSLGFEKSDEGDVCLLPCRGKFKNMTERVYLDSIAAGGRNVLDAVAIELLYPDEVGLKAKWGEEAIEKVSSELYGPSF